MPLSRRRRHGSSLWAVCQGLGACAARKRDKGGGDLNWIIANLLTAAALKQKGYHYRFVYAKSASHRDSRVDAARISDQTRGTQIIRTSRRDQIRHSVMCFDMLPGLPEG
jgi:hypothetical protein